MNWTIVEAIYLVGFALQAIVGALRWCSKDPSSLQLGARILLLSPVWPAAIAAAFGLGVRQLWRDAAFFPPKVLPPPTRGDQIAELERVIDEATAQLERL